MRCLTGVVMGVTLVLMSACSNSASGPSGPGGTLSLMIKDSPYSDAKSLLVTFSEVTVHRTDSDGGRTKLPFADGGATRTCDLKTLVDSQDVLGVGPLAEGRYTMLRLVVSRAALYFDNPSSGPACAPTIDAPAGRSDAVEIPSGEVKLNRQFSVAQGGATTILIDFDGDRSVNQMGNGRFRMTPVIGVVSVN